MKNYFYAFVFMLSVGLGSAYSQQKSTPEANKNKTLAPTKVPNKQEKVQQAQAEIQKSRDEKKQRLEEAKREAREKVNSDTIKPNKKST